MSRTTDLTNPIFTDLDAALVDFEAIRWPHGPYCPYCGTFDFVAPLGGKSMGPGWYHCRPCRRKFTAAVGTIYERSHIPLTKWLLAATSHVQQQEGYERPSAWAHAWSALQNRLVHGPTAFGKACASFLPTTRWAGKGGPVEAR